MGKSKNRILPHRTDKSRKKKTKKKESSSEIEPKPNYSSAQFSVRSVTDFCMDNRTIEPDGDSEPDRSEPMWKIVSEDEESTGVEEEATSIEEESIKPIFSLWDEIMLEYEDKMYEFNTVNELEKPFEPALPVLTKLSAVQYLNKHIFPVLCPALEETLFKARDSECLMIQKCCFNGLDYISELLWNRNPLHPERLENYRTIFNIPFVIVWLYYNPRPIYPLSWLWTKEEAIIVMQSYIRRYLIFKEPDCAEMRQFWKDLQIEKEKEQEAKWKKSDKPDIVSDLFDLLLTDVVERVEFKPNACGCTRKPCKCICRCKDFCKCCNCFRRKKPHQVRITQEGTAQEETNRDSVTNKSLKQRLMSDFL